MVDPQRIDGPIDTIFHLASPASPPRYVLDPIGTLRTGAKPERLELTKRDKEICEALRPALKERGLFFSGIDVIGDYLTEINVTSPTGIVIADKLDGRTGKDRIAEQFWRKLF